MKKFAKALLAITMAVAMVVPAALGVAAAELTINESGQYGNLSSTGGCGFLDGNLYTNEGLKGANTQDLTVTVNGKTAYFNNGYLGQKHCGLNTYNEVAGAWLQVGIVGADLVVGDNTLVVTDTEGNTITRTFTSSTVALGYSYAKVVGDAKAKTAKAEIVFNTDPNFAIGTTFEGRCHDDHNSKGEFKVTAYDAETKMYTIESTDFVTKQSLLELKVTSEGTYKDAWISATINSYNGKISDGGVIGGTKVSATGVSSTLGNVEKMFDGKPDPKLEGNFPSEGVTITFTTAEAVKIDAFVFWTHDDGSWNNRAPKAFKLYGVKNGTDELIKDVTDAGIGNVNNAPFLVDIDATTAYDSYKLVVTDKLGGNSGYFQIGDLDVYSVAPVISTEPVYEQKTGVVAFNGTEPKAPETVEPETTVPETKPVPAPTGDMMIALVAVAVVSLAGVAVCSKKRNSVN